MTDREDDLEELVRGAERDPDVDYAALFGDVERQIARADSRPFAWLRARATWVRRAIAIGAAFAIAAIAVALGLRDDLDEVPLAHVGIAAGSLAALLVLSIHEALRPLHRPARSRWTRAALTALALAATLLVAVFPPDATRGDWPPAVSPCLFYGLLAGVPIYALLRVLDRGASSAPLLGACAAGLLGNLVLQLFCPSHDVVHLMFGHFGVAAIFVLGVALFTLVVRRR